MEKRFLLAFHGRNLGSWSDIGSLPMKEVNWLVGRTREELEKLKKAAESGRGRG